MIAVRWRVLSCAILVMALHAGAAFAGDEGVAAQVLDGERRYAELDYRGAAEVCEKAARDAHASKEEQARGWSCAGISWLVLNQRTLAREALDHAFTIDRDRVIAEPSLSPRQTEFIEEVRRAHPKSAPVTTPVPTVAAPAAVVAPRPPRTPVWKRWYLWTPIAVGVVGLGLGLGLGLRRDGPTGTLPPGTVGLALHF